MKFLRVEGCDDESFLYVVTAAVAADLGELWVGPSFFRFLERALAINARQQIVNVLTVGVQHSLVGVSGKLIRNAVSDLEVF